MIKYIIKRIILIVPILLGVSFLVFTILSFTPGDPATIILGNGAEQEAVEQLNEELGYNRPFLERYFTYIGNIVTGLDFGFSYRTRQPIREELVKRLPISFKLAFFAVVVACLIGIPVGILTAVKQYTVFDTGPTLTALLFAAFPTFWLGMILLYVFSLKLGLLPSYGAVSWYHFILPVLGLGLPEAATLMRFTRSSMLETVRQDYIRTARSKGAPERRVIWRHAFKNALIPIVTIVGVDFAALMGDACATEVLYSMPGLCTMIINGIRQKDVPSVMGATLLLTALCALVVLLVDIIYAYIDPRIAAKYSGRRG
ncbi:MAG: ABC transporter permease [Deltaproteobacteria bacterium]|jgi:peptide/nickel transport system permease protein|nr:ABC transporter permease [Deltaproteobacteria bacterium]